MLPSNFLNILNYLHTNCRFEGPKMMTMGSTLVKFVHCGLNEHAYSETEVSLTSHDKNCKQNSLGLSLHMKSPLAEHMIHVNFSLEIVSGEDDYLSQM